METRNIYRGTAFLGCFNCEEARDLLFSRKLHADDLAGEEGETVGKWVAWGDDIDTLPRPPVPPVMAATLRRIPLPLTPAAKPRRPLRRDFLMGGLGAVAGGMAVKAWGDKILSPERWFGSSQREWMAGLLERALVMVRIDAPPTGTGTGFCIAGSERPGLCIIATASHVVGHVRLESLTEDSGVASLVTPDAGRSALLSPWIWEAEMDICAVTAQLGMEPLRLADQLPQKWDPVTAAGFLQGKGILTSRGIVTGFQYDGVARMETSAETIPGFSGGPVLNDQGEVVGMSVTRSINEVVRSYSVPLQELRNLVGRVAFLRRMRESA